MVFELRKIIVQIHLKKLNVSKSFRLVSPTTTDNVYKKIKNDFDEGNETMIKIIDNNKHKTKSFSILETQLIHVQDKIKNHFDIETNKDRYRVVVDNKCSNQIDKKAFVFNMKGDIQQVKDIVQKKVLMIIENEKEKDKDIIFDYQRKKTTHVITIYKCGSMEHYKKFVSKSFSVSIPNHSSCDIVNLMRDEL